MTGCRKTEDLIPEILDQTGAILMIDGLDEISFIHRGQVLANLDRFSQHLVNTKIIATCRVGDYNDTAKLSGFTLSEMCPLSVDQIKQIATLWLPGRASERFLEKLYSCPYSVIANRPLFLCHLLVLFENTRDLPARPAGVYRKIVRLLLEDWDEKRQVTRISRYSGFDPDAKLAFLAALAYELTYSEGTTTFERSRFMRCYLRLNQRFGLPSGEAEAVAAELETHTGIFVESGSDRYEFSHLSIQEYLAGYYLARGLTIVELIKHISQYPAPVAVAVTLASYPGDLLGRILQARNNDGRSFVSLLDPQQLASFAYRLVSERPGLGHSEILGEGILRILDEHFPSVPKFVDTLLSFHGVAQAVGRTLTRFSFAERESFYLAMPHIHHVIEGYPSIGASGVRIQRRIICNLSETINLQLCGPRVLTQANGSFKLEASDAEPIE